MTDRDLDDGPSVVVQVTPHGYRRRAVVFLSLGVVVLGTAVGFFLTSGRTVVNPVWGLAGIAYGGWCAVQARRQRTSTTVRVDRSGLRTGDGLHDHTWSGVVMVWVGSSSGLRLPYVAQPVLSVFTRAGVDFADRAGTHRTALYTLPVGGPWRMGTLVARLSEITDATVVDGRGVSRRRAAAALR